MSKCETCKRENDERDYDRPFQQSFSIEPAENGYIVTPTDSGHLTADRWVFNHFYDVVHFLARQLLPPKE